VLEGAIDRDNDRFAVLPRHPTLYLDRQYVLYGVGLVSSVLPDAALAIAREVLTPL